MSRQCSWRDDAREAIQLVLLEHEAQSALLGEPMSKPALIKAIADAYPYGARAYHPYKSWLKERKLALMFFDLMRVGTFGYTARQFTDWSRSKLGKPNHIRNAQPEGQMSLL